VGGVWRECSHGFPQELQHFVDCVLEDREPLETGEDGRAPLETTPAAYESAATGRPGGVAVGGAERSDGAEVLGR
jgi:predicted dehydrogenase